jgi:hypothetical protein
MGVSTIKSVVVTEYRANITDQMRGVKSLEAANQKAADSLVRAKQRESAATARAAAEAEVAAKRVTAASAQGIGNAAAAMRKGIGAVTGTVASLAAGFGLVGVAITAVGSIVDVFASASSDALRGTTAWIDKLADAAERRLVSMTKLANDLMNTQNFADIVGTGRNSAAVDITISEWRERRGELLALQARGDIFTDPDDPMSATTSRVQATAERDRLIGEIRRLENEVREQRRKETEARGYGAQPKASGGGGRGYAFGGTDAQDEGAVSRVSYDYGYSPDRGRSSGCPPRTARNPTSSAGCSARRVASSSTRRRSTSSAARPPPRSTRGSTAASARRRR